MANGGHPQKTSNTICDVASLICYFTAPDEAGVMPAKARVYI